MEHNGYYDYLKLVSLRQQYITLVQLTTDERSDRHGWEYG
jgi:hypothetical protein